MTLSNKAINSSNRFVNINKYYYYCMCACARSVCGGEGLHMCLNVYMEIKGQLYGVSSLLPPARVFSGQSSGH